MELLFTWIESYRNIRNQGINFSSEFNISFDSKENILSIGRRLNFIPSFFGDKISDISVIVGENGTGKTSILNIGEVNFYLGREGDIYFIVCPNKELLDKISFKGVYQNIIKHQEFNFADTLIINYSNYIDGSIDDKGSGLFPFSCFYDLSTNNIIKRITDFDKTIVRDTSLLNQSPFTRQIKSLLSEIDIQLDFLLKDNNSEKLKFKTPEVLSLEFSFDSEVDYLIKLYEEGGDFNDLEGYENVKIIVDCFLENHLSKQFNENLNSNSRDLKLNISDKEYALFLLRWSMFLSFINSFSSPNIDANAPDEELAEFDKNWKTEPIELWFDYFFGEFIIQEKMYKGSKFDAQIKAWAANASPFVKHFEELLNSEVVIFEISKNSALYNSTRNTHGLALTLKIDISNKDCKEFLYERLVVNYRKIQDPLHWRNDNRGFLSFSWRGISTGEIAIFRLLSRFNNLRNSIKKRKEINSPVYRKGDISNLLFLIDEGEIGLHPAWQQQFLSILIDNLPLMFEDLGVESIQLILTTHSPFILSDVPNNNIIFLEKNERGECIVNKNPLQDKKMTFGANIHSLLSDGFFMKEGLMGDFAKRKINQLIDDLIDSGMKLLPQKKQEIQTIIPIIGEPIIRKKIFDLYNEKINLSIDDRIKLLEESKEKLEKDILMLKTKRDDSDNKS